jgi:serine/threonine-protein kinase
LATTLQEPSDACDAGLVVAQSPDAGIKVKPGSFVTITIASGPASITVDDYTCETFSKAQNQISHAGLHPEFGGTMPLLPQCPGTNRIVHQEPQPGATLQPGDTVTLWTGSATSTPTTSPTP